MQSGCYLGKEEDNSIILITMLRKLLNADIYYMLIEQKIPSVLGIEN
jgi:hypothetical protein